MATHHPIRKTVPAAAPVIPDKLYFRIGDVARLLEVPAYVLRFWETEFPQLKPNKGGTGQRLYRKRDVEMALRIKTLLYDQGYTIPGARQVFKNEVRPASQTGDVPVAAAEITPAPAPSLTIPEASLAARSFTPSVAAPSPSEAARREALQTLRGDLREMLAMLSSAVSGAHPAIERKTEPNAEPKLRAMRPRLVLEPAPPKPEKPAKPRLTLHQPGLFGFDDPTAS